MGSSKVKINLAQRILFTSQWMKDFSNDVIFSGMYLEKKAGTGKEMDSVTYEKYLLDFTDPKWKPPLANHCLILPST
jgi:hypothetical protein